MLNDNEKGGFVYILSNWTGDVIYTGVTNNLERRVYEHKNKLVKGFSRKYSLDRLVYFEQFDDIESAIAREKEIKGWRREKKNKLVHKSNPQWQDLSLKWYKKTDRIIHNIVIPNECEESS